MAPSGTPLFRLILSSWKVREDLCDYLLGESQAFDAGLGVLLNRLEEIGEFDNTLVVLSGDHGI